MNKFVKQRLSLEGYLGLHLTLGILTIIGATWLFSIIAQDVVNGEPLTVVDQPVSVWLHAHATPRLTAVMLAITNLHSTLGVLVITLIVAILLEYWRDRYWLLVLTLSVPGGMLLNVLLKNLFDRPRPKLDHPILTLTGYSFPSGHTMAATVLYATLASFAASKVQARSWRVLAILVAACAILLVGVSRIYLGAHYLSDVLAAMAEGLAWLAFCLTGVETMRRYRQARRTSNSRPQAP
jgi:membrane-associated phospholipid phosphatase